MNESCIIQTEPMEQWFYPICAFASLGACKWKVTTDSQFAPNGFMGFVLRFGEPDQARFEAFYSIKYTSNDKSSINNVEHFPLADMDKLRYFIQTPLRQIDYSRLALIWFSNKQTPISMNKESFLKQLEDWKRSLTLS